MVAKNIKTSTVIVLKNSVSTLSLHCRGGYITLSLLTFFAHAVIVAFVVEASVVIFTLVLSQVAARALNRPRTIQSQISQIKVRDDLLY